MSKLVPCKSCEHDVDKTAKNCPNCGVKSPGVKGSDTAKGCLGMVILLVIITLIINSCTSDSDDPVIKKEGAIVPATRINTELAQKYVVLNTQTYATPRDKLGLKFIIYSKDADTFEKRAQTLIKASYELLEGRNLYQVVVRLSALPTIEPDYIHAGLVTYSPHGKNTWGNDLDYVWDVLASPNHVVNGQIEEDGKLYSLDFMTTKVYLRQ